MCSLEVGPHALMSHDVYGMISFMFNLFFIKFPKYMDIEMFPTNTQSLQWPQVNIFFCNLLFLLKPNKYVDCVSVLGNMIASIIIPTVEHFVNNIQQAFKDGIDFSPWLSLEGLYCANCILIMTSSSQHKSEFTKMALPFILYLWFFVAACSSSLLIWVS